MFDSMAIGSVNKWDEPIMFDLMTIWSIKMGLASLCSIHGPPMFGFMAIGR